MSAPNSPDAAALAHDIPPITCPECGMPLLAEGERCPRCSSGLVSFGRSRTVFLSLCGLLLVPMFTTTGVIVRLFHDKQANIAVDWEKAGDVNLATNHAPAAIEDYRNALLYSPGDSRLQLELADALAAQGQLDEANNYLSSLRTADPENSMINLEMARISARQGDVEAAVGYYHDAAFGQWPSNAHDNRVACREELINFLLQHDRADQARAEAISMAADNPADPDIRATAANLILKAGDTQGAFDEYQRVLRLAPDNENALLGGGDAALALYNFPEAERYLSRAIEHGAKDPQVAENRALAAAAAELDPYDPRLNDRERRGRILEIFTDADQRTKACASVTNPALPAGIPARLTQATFDAHPELASQALDWAFSVEKGAPAGCGETLADRAIAALAGKNKQGG
jgi:tetratricopeptide (TPR) repeat protein